MTKRLWIAAAAAVLAILQTYALRADDDVQRLHEALRTLEMQNELFRRLLPPAPTIAEQQAFLEQRASTVPLEVSIEPAGSPERLLFANGAPSHVQLVRFDISGRDRYGRVEELMSRIGLSTRLVFIESLQLNSQADDTVTFDARVALASYAGEADTSPSNDRIKDLRTRIEHAQMQSELNLALQARPTPATAAFTLAKFMKAAEPHPITLSRVALGDTLKLEGHAIGERAAAALNGALSSAPLKITSSRTSADGLCRQFFVEASLTESDAEPEFVAGNGLFRSPLARCSGVPKTARSLKTRGTDPSGITIKMPNVELGALFLALHHATNENFIVDGSLSERVSVDIESATLDEVIALLASSGVRVGAPPLRTVSRVERIPSSENFTGERISFVLSDADMRDVLCLFGQISGLEVHAKPNLDREVSIFAKDVEWDRAMVATLTSADLTYRIDDTRVLIDRTGSTIERGGLDDACKPKGDGPTYRAALDNFQLQQMNGKDLELGALVRSNGEWRAYGWLPTGRLALLEAGTPLADVKIDAIDAAGVKLANGTRIPLR